MKFSKKDFQDKYKAKEVEELYDPNKGEIGGDTVITHNQISVDTPVIPGDDTSDRKKGISKDTEKHVAQTKNQSADMAMSRFNMGTAYGYVREDEKSLEETAKDKMRKIVKELLQSRNDSSDLVKNNQYSDINSNEIPDLEEIDDIYLSKLVDDMVNSLNGKEEDIIAVILNDLVIKLGDKLSPDYKNIIKGKL